MSTLEVDPRIALTGRVQTALETPDKGTMPVSCTVYDYADRLRQAMTYVDIALRGGAGINVILDEFVVQPKARERWVFEYSALERKCVVVNEREEGFVYRVIKVADSMEDDGKLPIGTVSIQDSWGVFYEHLIEGAPVAVDLSRLRPKGTINKVGLEASGADSFATIYKAIAAYVNTGQVKELMNVFGTMNEVLRRGGQYKNGIVTFSMCTTNPSIVEYLNIPLSELAGSAKKGVRVDEDLVYNKRLFNLVNVRVRDKSLMLEKIQPNGLRSNVCREILLKHTGTCLIIHPNLGMCAFASDIIAAYEISMTKLVELHLSWQRHPQYASSEDDRQVGCGVIGLANLLGRLGIKYKDFIQSLQYRHFPADNINYGELEIGTAEGLVNTLYVAYHRSAEIARSAGLERAFTVAPTQTCAYNHLDLLGKTTCKNINPPLAQRVQRKSGTMGHMNKWYYHGKVETIADILNDNRPDSTDLIQLLWEGWQVMMNSTGLAHTASFDLYVQPDAEGVWLKDFILTSPLQTVYYNMSEAPSQSYLNKGDINYKITERDLEQDKGCVSCSE